MAGDVLVFLVVPVALAGAFLLTIGGLAHVRHRSSLRTALRAQRLLPHAWLPRVAVAVTAVELVVGTGVLAAVAAAPSIAWAPLILQGIVYSGFTAYLTRVMRVRPGAPCGCLGGHDAVTWATIGRAGLLACGSFGGAALTVPLAALPVQMHLMTAAAGVLVAATAWLVPALFLPPLEGSAR